MSYCHATPHATIQKESNAAHVAYALVPSILCTRQQQCMMQLMPCMWSAMHLHEPVPYCVMLNAVLQCMSHVSSAALSCSLMPCVNAVQHEPCVQCGTAMQAAAMCLLQPTGWCSLCSQAEDGAALPDNTRPHRASRDQRLCASCAATAASTITKSVRRLQQRRQSCTAQPHGETIASSRH